MSTRSDERNRAQRRAGLQPTSTSGIKERHVQTSYGHDGDRVMLRFEPQVHYWYLTEEACEKVIEYLQGALAALRAAKAGKPSPPVILNG